MAFVQKAEEDTSGAVTSRTSGTLGSVPTQGNLLILFAAMIDGDTGRTVNTPSGWTKLKDSVGIIATGDQTHAIFYKIAGASEAQNVTWTWTNNANQTTSTLIEWSNVNPSTPIDVSRAAYVADTDFSTTWSAPPITTVTDNAVDFVVAAFKHVGPGYTGPAGYAEQTDNAAFSVYTKTITPAGDTGIRDGTNPAWEGVLYSFAVRSSSIPTVGLTTGLSPQPLVEDQPWSFRDEYNFLRYFAGLVAAANVTVTPSIASLILAGLTPQLQEKTSPSVGALVLAGLAPVLKETTTPTVAALILSASTPTVSATNNVTLTPAIVALVLATIAPQLQEKLTPSIATLTLAGQTSTVAVGANIQPTAATLTLASAAAPTLKLSIPVTTATLVINGQTPTANVGVNVQPATATLSLNASPPLVTATQNVNLSPAAAALITSTFVARLDMSIPVAPRAVITTTQTPSVTATTNYVAQPATASLTLSTFAPSVLATGQFSPGTFSVSDRGTGFFTTTNRATGAFAISDRVALFTVSDRAALFAVSDRAAGSFRIGDRVGAP